MVCQQEAPSAGPVNSGLDRHDHSLFYCAGTGLVRVGPLVGAGADAVADGGGGLPGVATFGDAGANELVELWETGTVTRKGNSVVENFQQKVEQFVILRF